MLTRGAQAMGFDQERTTHHFLLYENGGAIDVAVKEVSDHANLHAIRQHLPEIAGLFKAGDFAKPALTHAQQVPGTVEMARLKDRRFILTTAELVVQRCEKRARILELATHCLAVTSAGIPESILSGWEAGIRPPSRSALRRDLIVSAPIPP